MTRRWGLGALGDFAVRDEAGSRAEIYWAIATLAVVAALVAVTAYFYISPTGRETYHAQMIESGGISAGTEVRVAGIPVGKVTDVTLGEGRVDVTMSVESSVFIGDQTSLDVRMLTVVGGAFVALRPAGDKPLGDKPIPASRTSIPYSMSEVLDAAAHTVAEIDAPTMRRTAVTVTKDLENAPGAVRGIVGDLEKLTALVDDQQNQITKLAALGNEYTTELSTQRSVLEQMIRRITATLPVMIGYKDRGILTYDALGEMVLYVGDILGEPYEKRLKGPAHQLVDTVGATKVTVENMGAAIDRLKTMLKQLTKVSHPGGVTLDFSDQIIDDKTICIPIPGRRC